MAKKLRAASKSGTDAETNASPPSSPTEGEAPAETETTEGAKAAKKRGRPRLTTVAMANVSDETIREKVELAAAARVKLNTAQGEYRAAVKSCRMVGMEPADVTWYLAARARDTRDVDAETRRRTRLAAVMGLPLSAQLGLFEDGETAATKAEAAQIARNTQEMSSERSIADARKKGADHGSKGITRVDSYVDGSPEQLAYDEAWTRAQRELTEQVFGSTPAVANA